MVARISAYVIFILAFVYLLVGANIGLSIYGEGLSLYGAMRVLDGEVPYRDFWSMYAPGELYLLALLFTLLGPSVIAARLLSLAIIFGLVLTLYVLLRRSLSGVVSLIGLGLAVVWLGASFRFFTYPVFPALLLILLSTNFLLRYQSSKRVTFLLLSGFFAGFAAFFRHDLAAYALVAETITLLGFELLSADRLEREHRSRLKHTLVAAGLYVAGAGIFIVPVGLYFVIHVPVQTLIADLIVFPARIFPGTRGLPYPPPRWENLLFYVPFVVHAMSTAFIIRLGRAEHGRLDSARKWTLILFTALGILFFGQARVRSDIPHLFPFLLSAVPGTCFLLGELVGGFRWRDTRWWRSPFRLALLAVLFLVAASVVVPIKQRGLLARSYLEGANPLELSIERGRGIIMTGASKTYEDMILFLQEAVPEGGRIYGGTLRHDLVSFGDAMLYFLSDRNCCTGYYEIHPGLTTTRSVQEQIVRDIEFFQVEYVVLFNHFEKEPNESSKSSGVFILDRFIRENFEPVRQFHLKYTVWKRTAG
ncbi:MAG: glycosyltransferase family 39 protein [Candidatus Eisenbacteria sp.]|nr:glycosyltransferase family 39 protein [Candidatus Eisenbacteria bacterium]